MKYGIQMYSLRDITKEDLDGALGKVAAMGYKSVEFAGFFDHTAEEVKAMLDKYDLELAGTHSPMGDLVNKFDETLAYHKAIGNKRYIIPAHDFSTRAKLDEFIKNCNEIAPKLRAEGIELYFHNHHREFLPMGEEGYVVHTELETKTDIRFEIDTYWSYVAGLDSVELLKRLGDRVDIVHLKDGDSAGKGISLGQGTAPVKEVREYALAHGQEIVVESEGLDPTGEEEVRRCIDFLHSLD